MAPANTPRCITCGHPVGDPPQLNVRADGRPCPTCAERLLESIPAALPTGDRGSEVSGEALDAYGDAEEPHERSQDRWPFRPLPGNEPASLAPRGEDEPA